MNGNQPGEPLTMKLGFATIMTPALQHIYHGKPQKHQKQNDYDPNISQCTLLQFDFGHQRTILLLFSSRLVTDIGSSGIA